MIVNWPHLACGAALGLVAGSFCATLAVRVRTGAGLALGGRSRCDHCGRGLSMIETLPLAAYVARRGVCAGCGGAISRLHPVGEALGALVVVSALSVSSWPDAGVFILLGFVLLAAGLVDAAVLKLPDGLTIAVAGLAGLLAWRDDRLVEGLVSAAFVGGALLGLRWLMTRRLGRQALGLGDVKLAMALAVWLGGLTSWALVLAGLAGMAFDAVRRPAERRLAFGPCLAAGAWVVGLAAEVGAWPM
ncbi:MAG: A24 family peptidase [Caulobacter sp.]